MMSHIAILESTYDGRIPPEALRHARAMDAAEAAARATPAPAAPRRGHGPTSIRAALAELMVTRAAIDGACTEADLFAAGFSRAELALHGEAARLRARDAMADRSVTR